MIIFVVITAAPPAHVDPELSGADLVALEGILGIEDSPEALANLFEGREVSISINICNLFQILFQHGRINSFTYLLSHLRLQPAKRDKDLTFLLHQALHHGNIVIASIILGQTFNISRQYAAVWLPHARDKPWDLAALRQFISDHPAHAASFVPNQSDFKYIRSLEDAFAMVELARHCAAVISQKPFDPTEFMENVIQFSLTLKDPELSQVILHLLQEGAYVDLNFLNHPMLCRLNITQTLEILRGWAQEDVKVTEEEAVRLDS
jgi:hypothetical protein